MLRDLWVHDLWLRVNSLQDATGKREPHHGWRSLSYPHKGYNVWAYCLECLSEKPSSRDSQNLSSSQTLVSSLSNIGVGLSIFSTNPPFQWGKEGPPSMHKFWYTSGTNAGILIGWSCGHAYYAHFLKSCAGHLIIFPQSLCYQSGRIHTKISQV